MAGLHPRQRVVAFALVAALAALILVVASRGDVQAEPGKAPLQAAVPGEPTIEPRLVERFAPVLYIRALGSCAGGAAFDPGPVSLVLDQPGVVLREIGR